MVTVGRSGTRAGAQQSSDAERMLWGMRCAFVGCLVVLASLYVALLAPRGPGHRAHLQESPREWGGVAAIQTAMARDRSARERMEQRIHKEKKKEEKAKAISPAAIAPATRKMKDSDDEVEAHEREQDTADDILPEGAPSFGPGDPWLDRAGTAAKLVKQAAAGLGGGLSGHPYRAAPNAGVVVALAMTYRIGYHKHFVGSLRSAGYRGEIILGLEPEPRPDVVRYLTAQNVTIKAVEMGPCKYAQKKRGDERYWIRHKCSKVYPEFKVEWARFALALKWLDECGARCTGWVLNCDYKDLVFAGHPFAALPQPDDEGGPALKNDLFLVQEYGLRTSHWFTGGPLRNCYGDNTLSSSKGSKPMLCSGTTFGTQTGIRRYLRVLTDEYRAIAERSPRCRPPSTPDQTVHNYLFYTGKFGAKTGVDVFQAPGAVVQTVGSPCSDKKKIIERKWGKGPAHRHPEFEMWVNHLDGEARDLGRKVHDVLLIDKGGYPLNTDKRRAVVLHQWDRCNRWMSPWIDHVLIKGRDPELLYEKNGGRKKFH